ncbi:hypothetical protein QWY77_09160 [Thalassotalea ponticola]|uniref:hypothetical protein n=1 Tax=Thalassotalea ponticola TaxID=1523392 RepID=UPI0025B3848D|nr:hypothetical protein [Thalassotalea ponticola]MDN3652926.1 hypothetical protein [Thalassotalea ponticola]
MEVIQGLILFVGVCAAIFAGINQIAAQSRLKYLRKNTNKCGGKNALIGEAGYLFLGYHKQLDDEEFSAIRKLFIVSFYTATFSFLVSFLFHLSLNLTGS